MVTVDRKKEVLARNRKFLFIKYFISEPQVFIPVSQDVPREGARAMMMSIHSPDPSTENFSDP